MTGYVKRRTDCTGNRASGESKDRRQNKKVQELLESYDSIPLNTGTFLTELIRRPELDYDKLAPIDPERPDLPAEVAEQVNISIKYDGYIKRQMKQVERLLKKLEKEKDSGKTLTMMMYRVCVLRHVRN